jgi:glutathione S-transferase
MTLFSPTLLIRDARCIVLMDDAQTELKDASLMIRGHVIEKIGSVQELLQSTGGHVDEVIDARGHIVMPGMVNTHHHMYQSLTRAIPAVQNAELFGWLRGLYPIWAGLTLFETETIVDYLDTSVPAAQRLIPDDAYEAAQMRMWLALEQGTHKEFRPLFYLHTIRPILQQRYTSRQDVLAHVPQDIHPSYAQWIGDVYEGKHRFDTNESLAQQHILHKLDKVEVHLQRHAYLAGARLSFADIAWFSRIQQLNNYGMTLDAHRYPSIALWLETLKKLPQLKYA